MSQIIDMVIRQVMRRLVNTGVNKGIDAMAKRGEGDQASPEQKAASQQTAGRAKQAMRVVRRFGRF